MKARHYVVLFFLALLVSLGINHFGIALSVVNGTSMNPTIHHGDYLFVNKFILFFQEPQRGEIITFRDPYDPKRFLVKRVIGIPGDKIEIKNQNLYVNTKEVAESYIDTSIKDGNFGPVVVSRRTVFVMGDNRHRFASRDSRYANVGMVPFALIDGKVEWIVGRPL